MRKESTGGRSRLAEAAKAIVFDYGNTIVPFAEPQIHACDRALADALERLFGPMDFAELHRIRNEDRLAPYAGDPPRLRENDLPSITARAVRRLYGRDATRAELDELLRVRYDAFLAAVEAPPHAAPLLRRLAARFRLALLSNYPDGGAIRASLKRTGLAGFFECVVVSADIGRVKPHPEPFALLLRRMRLTPGEALFVGDNWFADVQGARRAGMRVVWTTQWDAPERMPRQPGDLEPDAVIGHLEELEGLLL